MLRLFESDPMTDHVVLIGEIGGSEEERAAQFIAAEMSKPVTVFIAGRTAPPGKRMGHAGAIIEGGEGTAQEKIAAFERVGVPVARQPAEVAELVAQRM
jgi:succinyl-CoA synthetase alpha subunit